MGHGDSVMAHIYLIQVCSKVELGVLVLLWHCCNCQKPKSDETIYEIIYGVCRAPGRPCTHHKHSVWVARGPRTAAHNPQMLKYFTIFRRFTNREDDSHVKQFEQASGIC